MSINTMPKSELNIMLTMLAHGLSGWRYLEANELGCGVFIEAPVTPQSREVKVINYCEDMNKLMPLLFEHELSLISPSRKGDRWRCLKFTDREPGVAVARALVDILSK